MKIKTWFRGVSAVVLTIVLSLTLFGLPANAFVFTDTSINLDHLLETNECNDCNLSGVDLSGRDLYGSALLRADLSGANLSDVLLNEIHQKLP